MSYFTSASKNKNMFFLNKCIVLIIFLGAFVQALRNETESCCCNKVTKRFYVPIDKANFFEALVHCKEGGMQLASIENEEESAALDEFLDPLKSDGLLNGFWLSGTHLTDTSSFQYYWLSTGERTIFENWLPGQPDNANGNEHCMQWVYSKAIGWNDWDCNSTIRYVCEYTP